MFVHAAKAAGDDQRIESGGWQGKKGGEITMEPPGQHVLARTNVMIDVRGGGGVEARFTVALPARGRSIEGQWCSKILLERLPDLVARSLLFSSLDAAHLRAHILSVEDQDVLRSILPAAGLVGFVRNGAILPRKSGHLDLPMDASTALPFKSPPSLEREVSLPNAGKIKGMGVPKGITLIVGGGFHGKSTVGDGWVTYPCFPPSCPTSEAPVLEHLNDTHLPFPPPSLLLQALKRGIYDGTFILHRLTLYPPYLPPYLPPFLPSLPPSLPL
jgi:hypothetical protein